MVKEAACDLKIKNKYGYKPYDMAYNMEVRKVFEKFFQELNF